MTNDERKKLKDLKSDINKPKHELIRILSEIEIISPRQAESLSKIIGRIEYFQNR